MLKPTKIHKEKINNKNTVKIGNTVPKGAVNLGYFYNKRVKNGGENVLVSEAPKTTINHISVSETVYKYCIPEKKNSYFDSSFYYSDSNGYQGDIPLANIKWYDHEHSFSKDVKVVREVTVTEQKVPNKTISYSEKHSSGTVMTGTLGATNVTFTPIEYKDEKTSSTSKKMIRSTKRSGKLSSANYDFPSTIDYNSNGYTGSLSIISNSKRFIPTMTDSTVTFKKKTTSTKASSIVVDGITLPLLEANEILDKRQAYGFTRYWGPTALGSYGNWGDSGNFTDSTPNNQLELWKPNRVGIFISNESTGSPNSALGGVSTRWWDNSSGNIIRQWTYDTSLADEIVGAGNHNGGCAWVKEDTLAKLAQKVGDTKKAAELLNISHPAGSAYLSARTYTGTTITDFAVLYNHIYYSTSVTGHVNDAIANDLCAAGVIANTNNKYFRDVVCFYKGIVTSNSYTYGKNVITTGEISYKAEADYQGVVTKTTETVKRVPSKWKATITYEGTIKGGYTDYNGVATYTGVATKKNDIGNITPIGDNVIIMYPDSNGVLYEDYYDPTSNVIESEQFEVTNVFVDDVPLFYSYRLKNIIYDGAGPNEFGISTNNSIVLLNSRNKKLSSKYKYAVKLTPASEPNTYYADIYTSFTTNSKNPIYCSYTAYSSEEGEINRIKAGTKEQIYVQPAFQKTTDYTMQTESEIERKNSLKINKPLLVKDTRNKINFEYEVVLFKDGKEIAVSDAITATGINKRYALNSELKNFIGRNYIVSPQSKAGHKTAYELLANKTTASNLKNGTFEVRLTSNSINNNIYNIVNLYTSPNGDSVVSAEIITDTGFKDAATNKYTKMIDDPGKYIVADNYIRCAYAVKCTDAREIKVVHPRESELLKDWYSGIQFGHHTIVYSFRDVKKKYVYTIPEFDTQDYSPVGKPYIRVEDEKATYVNESAIKVKMTPLYAKLDNNKMPVNLTVKLHSYLGNYKELEIKAWDYEEGVIFLNEKISETDNITVTYDYEESQYIYRGYYNEGFNKIDLNTNKYHDFTDLSLSSVKENSALNLFNKTIYYFLRPTIIMDDFTNGGEVVVKKINYSTTVTNTTNNFDDSIYATKGNYTGTISKDGEAYVISGQEAYYEYEEFSETITASDPALLPSEKEVINGEYSGTIYPVGLPVEVNTGAQSLSKEVNIERTYSSFDDIEYNIEYTDGEYSGELLLKTTEQIITGYEQIETIAESKVIEYVDETTVYQCITNGYDSYIDAPAEYEYNDNEFRGTLNLTGMYSVKDENEAVIGYYPVYEGTVNKYSLTDDIDNPIYNYLATYSGLIYMEVQGTTVYEQFYAGILKKEIEDTRVWEQKYSGQLISQVAAEEEIEIVFAVDQSKGYKTIHKNLTKNISTIYSSLRSSGINKIKLGCVLFGDSKVKPLSFNGSQFTTNINLFNETIKANLNSITTTSNAIDSIIYIADNYSFTTNCKNIVVISQANVTNTSLMYNASNTCSEKGIAVHSATDTNSNYSKYLLMITNETNGAACEITNQWHEQAVSGIAEVCNVGTVKIVNKDTLYHKINDDVPESSNDLLIGSVFLRHYTSLESTQLIDSRSLGGGILESIKDNIRKELEPESDYYFDIGYWDGEPYNENAVVIIRLDKSILSQNGGRFSEADVSRAVDKWIAAGTIPIIEYVDTNIEINEICNNLTVESENGNKVDCTPEITNDVIDV